MRVFRLAAAGGAALILAACGGAHNSTLPPIAQSSGAPSSSSVRPLSLGAGPAFVQGANLTSSGQAATLAPVLSATPAANDVLIACVSVEDGNTIATPANWTNIGSQSNNGSIVLYEFYSVAAASSPTTFSFTASGAGWMSASVREYTGISTTAPLAGFAGSTSSGTKNAIDGPQTVSATPAVAGSLPVSCFAANSAMGVTAHTTGSNEDYTGYASTQNGKNWVSPYNGNEGQTGALQSGLSAYSSTVTWNVTANNGPDAAQALMLLAPQSGVTTTPSPQQPTSGAVGAPSYVQSFVASMASKTPAQSLTVPLGTSGTSGNAPSSAHDLIALVQSIGNQAGKMHAANPGSPWVTVSGGSVASPGWSTIDVFRLPAGSAIPSSVTFSNFGGTSASVEATATIVEVANSAGVEVVPAGGASARQTSGYASTTGTGTASNAAELPIIAGNLDDCCYSPATVTGFSRVSNGQLRGTGGATFSGQGQVLVGPMTSGTAIASTSMPWSGPSGTENVAGIEVLVIPGSGSQTSSPATSSPATSSPATSSPSTPVPTSAPTSTPPPSSGMPTIGNGGIVNGVEWPASFTPFASYSVWNTPVSSSPTYLANSSSIIASEFGGNPANNKPVRSTEVGQNDYGHGVVFAQSSDPLVYLSCHGYCDNADNGGIPSQMNIPAAARIPGAWNGVSGDHQLAIVQPGPGYQEIDTAYTAFQGSNWTNGSTFSTGGAANCGSFYSNSGYLVSTTAATVGGNCLSSGLIRANELLAGSINHALDLILECQGPGTQYPVPTSFHTDACPSGNGGPPLGARLWYDVPDATTNANSGLKPWEKAILNALHDYGGYFNDDSCPSGDGTGNCAVNVSGLGFMYESEEAAYDFGQSNPWAALASQGWVGQVVGGAGPSDNIRWVGSTAWNPSGVSFSQHMHWLAPCSAHASC